MKTSFLAGVASICVALTSLAFGAPGAQAAGSGTPPTINWAQVPANNTPPTVVHGAQVVFTASASPVAPAVSVDNVCATLDGQHITNDIGSGSGGYYNDLTASAGVSTFAPTTGCWTSNSAKSDGLTGLGLRPDTTTLTDGMHVLILTITDNLGDTASISTSFQTQNSAPAVSFLYRSNGDTVSGPILLTATGIADSLSTATVVTWCLKHDGAKETQNVASQTGAYYGDLQSPNATFDATTGCWTRADSSKLLAGGTFAYDTSTWLDGDHTFQLTITDTTPRTSTATITLHSVNGNLPPLPHATLTVSPVPVVVSAAPAKLTATCGITIGKIKTCSVTAKAGTKVVATGSISPKVPVPSGKVVLTVNATGRSLLQANAGVLPITVTATVAPTTGSKLTATATDSLVAKTVKVTLSSSVLFSSGSSVLTKSATTLITALGVKVKGSKSAVCAGYTDNQGSASYNLKLGLDRAAAVCAILKKYVKSATSKSYGMSHPVASNATESGRAKNRRVTVTISN